MCTACLQYTVVLPGVVLLAGVVFPTPLDALPAPIYPTPGYPYPGRGMGPEIPYYTP